MDNEVFISEKEIETLADILAEKLARRRSECSFTVEEQQALKDLLKTKKNAVRAFLWVSGALALWIIKDIYIYVAGHLAIR